MRIPARNIYYLFAYAWDRLEEADLVFVGKEESPSSVDLLARVLVEGVRHLMRRGIDRGYDVHRDAVRGVRGRILFSESVATNSFGNARAVCEFDELSYDVPHNRIIKEMLRRLLRRDELSSKTRHEVASLHRRLREVGEEAVTTHSFGEIQLHSNNAFYGFLLDICRFLHEELLPVSGLEGTERFWGLNSENGLWRVFQLFVERFYEREQQVFRVRRHRMPWSPARGDRAGLDLLPGMETDISLSSEDRLLVIDTKYYQQTLQTNFGKESFHSDHLYQLLSYLHNLRLAEPAKAAIEGMLLYPKTSVDLDHLVEIHGFPVRISTIDLTLDWKEIERGLLQLIEPWPAAGSIGDQNTT